MLRLKSDTANRLGQEQSIPPLDLTTQGGPKPRLIPRHLDSEGLPASMLEQEVASYTGIPMTKLARLRHDGGGPSFKKVGRLHLYNRTDLLAWLNDR